MTEPERMAHIDKHAADGAALADWRALVASLASEMREWTEEPRGEMVRSTSITERVRRWVGVLDLLARADAQIVSDHVVMAFNTGDAVAVVDRETGDET